jgi:iron complex outermembrane receptor protein
MTRGDLEKQGITSAEQLIGAQRQRQRPGQPGLSNADVVERRSARQQRRHVGQPARPGCGNATLVLLNGRRVAAHGLNGGVVDLNQIPFAAVERVEVLKDGASVDLRHRRHRRRHQLHPAQEFHRPAGRAFADVTRPAAATSTPGDRRHRQPGQATASTCWPRWPCATPRAARRPSATSSTPSSPTAACRGHARRTLCHGVCSQARRTRVSRDNINNAAAAPAPVLPGTARWPQRHQRARPAGARLQLRHRRHGALRRALWATPAARSWLRLGHRPRRGAAAAGEEHQPGGARHRCGWANTSWRAKFVAGQVRVGQDLLQQPDLSGTGTSNHVHVPSPFLQPGLPQHGRRLQPVFNALVAAFPAIEANRGLPMAFRWRCMPAGRARSRPERHGSRVLLSADGPLFGGWDYRAGHLAGHQQDQVQCWVAATTTRSRSRR